MPTQDESIVLVDESDKEYSMKYSVRKNRLSGGWRIFSVSHKLLEGDALLFHLIEPCKFRVYIIKASKVTENEGLIGMHTHDFPNIRPISSVKTEDRTDGQTTRRVLVNPRETKKPRIISEIKLSNSNLPEIDIKKGFDDFKIQMDGLILDPEIPSVLRTKYYNLCSSQKAFLHDCLIKGLSSKLVVAMICETINISDAIRSVDLATSDHCLNCWEKTLKAFEDLGMAVGFLRDRVQKLKGIKREHQVMLLSVRTLVGRVEAEVEALEWEDKKLCYEFQMLARAPW
ncbi:B3 domain-containing protein [Striga asiatica]|uniref:B3 domain-containing protein n=1 Tax=Striga asiatica TaxID=4170 RepID=A0A5A7QB39_STRAF|nr:B3 domain-containing protein [Striga asiatica]